jgi:hypothetical protein
MQVKSSQFNFFRWIWANTDKITKWAQIVGLILAGYWTYTKFFRVEAPSLAIVAQIELNHPSITQHGDSCRLRIPIIIHNEGHTSFDVGRLQIQGWHSEKPLATMESPAYFNMKMLKEGKLFLNVDSLPDSYLNKNYPPGYSYDQDFQWDFKHIDPLFLFEINAYDKENKLLNSVRWWGEEPCGK